VLPRGCAVTEKVPLNLIEVILAQGSFAPAGRPAMTFPRKPSMAPYKPSIALLAALASASGLHAQGVTLKPVVIQ
jgi:hypothetical protein